MTHAARRTHYAADHSLPLRSDEFPVYRSLTVYVTGGLDGAAWVVMMLRGRNYQVRALSVEVLEGVVESRIGCTVRLPASQLDLLLERLRRMPGVVSAEKR